VRVHLRVLLVEELLHRAAVGAVGLADDDDAVRADGVHENLGLVALGRRGDERDGARAEEDERERDGGHRAAGEDSRG
jgi:hypothetical protein